MLGISMSPASSSTLIHQVLRLRVRRLSKFIGSTSYSAAHSNLACLSLVLWRIKERRSSMRGCVSY